jgi:hypothetical protein
MAQAPRTSGSPSLTVQTTVPVIVGADSAASAAKRHPASANWNVRLSSRAVVRGWSVTP